ncbi:TniB family NTP-binding protein [Bradyrhizobium sp.]|uniref:TniB family NTP-binding protein n=1 Tax=Bradyrhizobium sp. TaxID=376 RepID=UPI001EB6C6A8|nr:TniB family NTP-binding protein [Bradyrhizobium sp.]MBV9979041.1 TniB family NTP-binding protein [Bradyrhizobium sp.]
MDDQMHAKSLLAASPVGERQMHMKNIFIKHDRFDDAWSFIRRAHYPVVGGAHDFGRIFVLAGESRAGKTSVAMRYMQSHPPTETDGGMLYPAVYVNVPIDGLRALLEFIAEALGIKYSLRINNHALLSLILNALRDQRVQLLFFDELNTVVNADNRRALSYTLTLLRKLLDHAHLNIVCIGLEETYDLLAGDPQLTGRGGLPYQIVRPYSWDNAEERKLFRLLCHQFDKQLPFEQMSGLQDAWFAERLFYSSRGGVIGRLRDFIYSAGCIALNEESHAISGQHFAQAYEFIKARNTEFNPWVHDMANAPTPGVGNLELKGKSPREVFSKTKRAA